MQQQHEAVSYKNKSAHKHESGGFVGIKKAVCVALMVSIIALVAANVHRPLGALNTFLGSSNVDTTPELIKAYVQQNSLVGLSLDTDSLDADGSYQTCGSADV